MLFVMTMIMIDLEGIFNPLHLISPSLCLVTIGWAHGPIKKRIPVFSPFSLSARLHHLIIIIQEHRFLCLAWMMSNKFCIRSKKIKKITRSRRAVAHWWISGLLDHRSNRWHWGFYCHFAVSHLFSSGTCFIVLLYIPQEGKRERKFFFSPPFHTV